MEKMLQNKNAKWIALILEFILYLILFFYKKVIHFDIISHLLMLAIIIVIWYYFFNKAINKISFTKTERLFLIIINLAISFFVSGKVLFLTDSVVSLNLLSILYYLLVNIFVFPFIYCFLYFIDNVKIVDKKRKDEDSKKFALRVLLLSFGCMFLVCLFFYPGNITSDTVSQISQALGKYPIDNAHPAICTIFIKIFMSIWNNPFVIVIANSLYFSIILTYIYKFLYDNKVNEMVLYITLLVFLLSINNLTLITMAWKDVPFTISMLWLTFETYKIAKYKEEYFKKIINIILFCIAMTFTYFFRHNGMFPFIIMILYLAFIAFKLKTKLRIVFTIILCIFSVWLVKEPIYNAFGVVKSDVITGGSASFAAKGLGALIYYDGDLSEEDLETISKLAKLDDLREYYSPYSIDPYSFSDINFSAGIDELGVAKIYEMYIKQFFKNPKIIIRDKLDGSNLLWSYDTPKDGFNFKFDYGIEYSEWIEDIDGFERNAGTYYIPDFNLPKEGVKVYQKAVNIIILLDVIFWRGGFVLSILLLLLFWMFKRKIKILPATFPTLISILFWLVLLSHQSYRYLWFMFVNTFFLILFALLEKNNRKN